MRTFRLSTHTSTHKTMHAHAGMLKHAHTYLIQLGVEYTISDGLALLRDICGHFATNRGGLVSNEPRAHTDGREGIHGARHTLKYTAIVYK
jgi:hypothetical protein